VKKINIFLNFVFALILFSLYSPAMANIRVVAKKHKKMKTILASILDDNSGERNSDKLSTILEQVRRDLELSQQFDIDLRENQSKFYSTKEIKKLYKNKNKSKIPLAIFINFVSGHDDLIQWRLYNTSNAKMIAGKKIKFFNLKLKHLAHKISDQIWPNLTGKKGCFSSVIVACKRAKNFNLNKNKQRQNIYAFSITDCLGPVPKRELIVKAPTVNFAPKWHSDKPLLFYSQHTTHNVRLMSIDHDYNNKKVTNFNGLNLTPTIAPNGTVVLVVSWKGKERLCKYEHKSKSSKCVSVSPANIHALCPKFIDNNHILFCAINSRNVPKIAILNLKNNNIKYITNSGYSVSPDYCKANDKIVFCKKVDGYQQIFTCNLKKALESFNDKESIKSFKKSKNKPENLNLSQVTFDNSDKDNCSFSPCGSYIIYSQESNNNSRIRILNTLTKKSQFITPKNEYWSFPAWSPQYVEIPFV